MIILQKITKKTLEFEQVENFSNHKTTVAGVISAERNGEGSVGVAYDAKLEGHSWNVEDLKKLKDYDVANNSWGKINPFADNVLRNQEAIDYSDNIEEAVKEGRDSLGTSVIFAGGNDRETGGNSNYHNLQNDTNVIATGSINKEGDLGKLEQTGDPFSSPGANLLVSAPGSDINTTANLLTNDNGSTFGSSYDSAQGTSFSAPITSGVVALMLEANPNLGYRDIQKILAYSARKVEDENTDWQVNGANDWNGGGLHTSHDYGFGNIDAYAAVRLAETWNTQNTYHNALYKLIEGNLVNQQIVDGSIVDIAIDVTDQISIEHVQLRLDIEHDNVSDLKITLISPDGTQSLMVDRPYIDKQGNQIMPEEIADYVGGKDFIDFIFSSTNHYGETSQGTWTLRIEDTNGNNIGGVLNNYKLGFKGSSVDNGNNTYIYTGEFGSLNEQTRTVLTDGNGGIDTINTSPIFTDTVINLAGGNSNIAGKDLSIVAEEIENVSTGDGHDTIEANSLDNVVDSGRGNDTITTGTGNDIFMARSKAGDTDIITDFDVMNDKIDITHTDITKASQLKLSADGADVTIEFGDSDYRIILQNTDIRKVTSTNFVNNEGNYLFGNIVKIISGTENNDYLTGTQNSDILKGGAGDDTLVGKEGSNSFTGGEGSDTFVITSINASTDTIEDFDASKDKLDLSDFSTWNTIDFSQLNMTQQNDDVVITFRVGYNGMVAGGDLVINGQIIDQDKHIVLKDTKLEDITGKNFIGITDDANSTEDLVRRINDSEITTGSGNDTIYIDSAFFGAKVNSGAGNDVIHGARHSAEITMGEGEDVYVVDGGYFGSDDTITDFDPTKDKIDLTHVIDKTDFSDLTFTQDGDHVVFVAGRGSTFLGGKKLILENVRVEDITSDNFIGISDNTIDNKIMIKGTSNSISGRADRADEFVIATLINSSSLVTTISNFDVNSDVLDFSLFANLEYDAIKYINDLSITQQGDDVSIISSNGKVNILLKNVSLNDINDSHFKGIIDTSKVTEDQHLIGDYKDNSLVGGLGNDTLDGSHSGQDTLTGNAGNDTFIIRSKYSYDGSIITDTITDFDPDEDKLDVSSLWGFDFNSTLMTENGDDLVITIGNSQELVLQNIKKDQITEDHFVTTPHNDIYDYPGSIRSEESNTVIDGDDEHDNIDSTGNNNVINANGNNDFVYSSGDNNQINGGDGDDTLIVRGNGNVINGGNGNDVLDSFDGNNNILNGEKGDDIFYLEGTNTVSGGEGDDIYRILNGFSDSRTTIVDFMKGDLIDLTKFDIGSLDEIELIQDGSNSIIKLSENQDIVLENTNISDLDDSDFSFRIIGTNGGDAILGSNEDDYIDGKEGDDVISSGNGVDTLIGGEGNDIFVIENNEQYDPSIFWGQPGFVNSVKMIEDFQIDYDKLDFSKFDTINSKTDFEMNAFESNMWEEDENGNWVETDQTMVSISANGVNVQIENTSLADFTENNFIFE